jgi:hemerythrin superfamily protein
MVEHAAIRLRLYSIREKNNADSIYELDDFVRNCHAKIEDEIIFPKLRQILGVKGEELVKTLSRLEADHRMIEKISEVLMSKTAEGDIETSRKRTMLYADVLESHNSSEETLVFPFWSINDPKEESLIMHRARKVIEEFGRDRYFRITGFSERLYSALS